MKKKSKKKSFPIGVKLAIIIGIIVLASLSSVTFLNSYFVSQDVRITAEENNLTINTRSASTVQNEISSVRSNAARLLSARFATEDSGGENPVREGDGHGRRLRVRLQRLELFHEALQKDRGNDPDSVQKSLIVQIFP